jgi:hypothetical protein
LDESNQWYYEAVSITSGVQLKIPGFRTTTHLTTKEDKEGNFLFGSNTYKLHLPAALSSANFWSLVLYSENTRCFIDNKDAADKMRATSVDSRDQNLVMNSDGSIDLYIGPVAPEGKKNNWLQTNVGEGWFPMFRTYGTQQYLLDNQWQPGEFEKLR